VTQSPAAQNKKDSSKGPNRFVRHTQTGLRLRRGKSSIKSVNLQPQHPGASAIYVSSSNIASSLCKIQNKLQNCNHSPSTIMSSSTVSKKPAQDAAPTRSGMVDSREDTTKASASVRLLLFVAIECGRILIRDRNCVGRSEPQPLRRSLWCLLWKLKEGDRSRW